MSDDSGQKQNWWSSLPGIITSISALITAIGGIIVILNNTPKFKIDQQSVTSNAISTDQHKNEITNTPSQRPISDSKDSSKINAMYTSKYIVQAKFDQLQTQYQQRLDMIPIFVSSAYGATTQNKFSSYLKQLVKLRASYVPLSSSDLVNNKISITDYNKFMNGQIEIDSVLVNVLSVIETQQLDKDNNTLKGMTGRIEGANNRIRVFRRDFTLALKNHNDKYSEQKINITM